MTRGGGASGFVVAGNDCTGKTVAAHQGCRITVQFKPAMAGQRSATITLAAAGACGYSFSDFLTLSGVAE
jgi:hypothetical protein